MGQLAGGREGGREGGRWVALTSNLYFFVFLNINLLKIKKWKIGEKNMFPAKYKSQRQTKTKR